MGADSGSRRNALVFGEELSEFFGWGAESEALAGPAVEFAGDGLELAGAVGPQVGALGEVFAEQAVEASMSSSQLVPGDGVLPGGLVGGHGAVYHVDQVALEDSPGSAGAFSVLVAGQ